MLEWVTTISADKLKNYFPSASVEEESDESLLLKTPENVRLKFYFCKPKSFFSKLFNTSCSNDFLEEWRKHHEEEDHDDEESIFKKAGRTYISPYLRETALVLSKTYDSIIQPGDVRGIIHSHSNWSDGVNTIEEMVKGAIAKGYEYLVISDHSKSAFYANGLSEERIRAQHEQIDEVNKKHKNFKVFKSIECDILNDGSLDYSNDMLSTFDLVIISVHSNLKMTEEKAMMRLLKALENPHVTILGHMTGRLLLSRQGYPVDHKKIIDACKANDVVIELNAHPRRLDMDWRHIDYAQDKGVMISVDPDAHSIDEFDNVRYGVLSAQKGGLLRENNLSSKSLGEFESWLGDNTD